MSEEGRQYPIKTKDMELKCLECGSNVVFFRNMAIEYIDKPNTYRIKEQFLCIRSLEERDVAFQNGNFDYQECTPLEVWSGEIRNKTWGKNDAGSE